MAPIAQEKGRSEKRSTGRWGEWWRGGIECGRKGLMGILPQCCGSAFKRSGSETMAGGNSRPNQYPAVPGQTAGNSRSASMRGFPNADPCAFHKAVRMLYPEKIPGWNRSEWLREDRRSVAVWKKYPPSAQTHNISQQGAEIGCSGLLCTLPQTNPIYCIFSRIVEKKAVLITRLDSYIHTLVLACAKNSALFQLLLLEAKERERAGNRSWCQLPKGKLWRAINRGWEVTNDLCMDEWISLAQNNLV